MSGSIADIVAPELPYLRRFARALTGMQQRGDAYVVAMLEAFVADQSHFRRDVPPKVAVYRSFLQVWRANPINRHAEPVELAENGIDSIVSKRIETLTPLPRQAFLLAALEGFTTAEISEILDIGQAEVGRLIDVAGKEIAEQIAARVLIIEDEPLIALDIEMLVQEIGHEVVGIAKTHAEATALARKTRPELVLADIRLADGSSGIDAVNDILMTVSVPVVFITAFPERLLTGARAEPAFLVTKPFKPEMVKAIVSQALFFDVKAGTQHGAAA